MLGNTLFLETFKRLLLHKNPRKTNQVWREIWGSFCHLFPTLTVCETKCVEWGGASPWGNSRDSSGLEQTKGNMHVNKFTMKATKDVDIFAVKIHYQGKALPKPKRSKIQFILPHLLNLYYRSKSLSSSERPIKFIISYPCPQCDVFVSH